MKHTAFRLLIGLYVPLVLSGNPLPSQETPDAAAKWVSKFPWQSIGPATMGGRITSISVFEKDPKIFYVSTASGGLLKTVNNGITFEHQFDQEAVVSIGDVCVAPSDSNIVWVGTGEENPRNSVSYGDGVYKSVDGGKTWKNMGLAESFQIGSIVVHPTNPDIVYVGVLGRLYGENEERGLYKTTDGGASWKKIHYVDEKTGVIAIQMHPKDPNTLVFATYERKRDGFDGNSPAKKIAPGSGLYRTKDAGKTFQKLTKGLPTNDFGRVGIDYFRKDPNVVFAIVECEMMGKPGENVGWSGVLVSDSKAGIKVASVTEKSPAAVAGLKKGDFVVGLNDEKVTGARKLIEGICRHEVGGNIELSYTRGGKTSKVSMKLAKAPSGSPTRGRRRGPRSPGPAGSRTYGGPVRFTGRLGGQGANLQGMQGKDGYEHGGIFRSDDGGTSWQRINSFDPRPMYFSQFRVDPNDTKFQYVLGISGAKSVDGGATFSSGPFRGVHADHHALWIDPKDGDHLILGCDGGLYVSYDRSKTWRHLNHAALGQFYHVGIGPRRDYWVYGGLQDNGTWGAPHRGSQGTGAINEDWIRIGGGDGFLALVDPNDPDLIYFESQNGATRRSHRGTGESGFIRPGSSRGRGGQRGGPQRSARGASSPRRYRYNWRTPFILSNHNSKIYYNVGNHVFRSLDRGNNLKSISPEITVSKRGSGTAISESPINPDVLYAGTDDGGLWMTRQGDHDWVNLREMATVGEDADAGSKNGGPHSSEPSRFGVPFTDIVKKPMWISGIEASRFAEGRVYVSVDGHRSNDDNPYLLVSEDFGETWMSIRSNLPRGSARVIREDRANENLLYAGTEFGLYVSLNRGKDWTRFHNNLPTVAVHEIAQHRSCGDIVIATHGRSLWRLDVTPLRQMTAKAMDADMALFTPAEVIKWRRGSSRGSTGGASRFVGQTPDSQTQIYFHMKTVPTDLKLQIKDATDKVIRDIKVKPHAGLNRVSWDGRPNPRPRGTGNTRSGSNRSNRFSRFRRTRGAAPGTYKVLLTADGKTLEATFKISDDPRPR
jgi:photosystem II stability/assembly factor-like uncharacterized protein